MIPDWRHSASHDVWIDENEHVWLVAGVWRVDVTELKAERDRLLDLLERCREEHRANVEERNRYREELEEAHTWMLAQGWCDCEYFPGAGTKKCRFAEALDRDPRPASLPGRGSAVDMPNMVPNANQTANEPIDHRIGPKKESTDA